MFADIPRGQVYVVKAMPTFRRPDDEVFQIYQVVECAAALDADNATGILEDLVHFAAHLEIATNPFHNDLVGTALTCHSFERRIEAFESPRGKQNLLVVDLVRHYVHVHRDSVWPQAGLFDALRRVGFDVVRTHGRWRAAPYQSLWRCGGLGGSYPRNPLARIDRQQEPIEAIWTNPRYCREVTLPYPIWPPQPASPELLARLTRWTPELDLRFRYEPALVRLNPASDAHALGSFLASRDIDALADWFETHAPRCFADDDDPRGVLSTVLLLESESPDGEPLAGALIRLAAKMRLLGYPMPTS